MAATKREMLNTIQDAVENTRRALELVRAGDERIRELQIEIVRLKWALLTAEYAMVAQPETERVQ